jgi:thiamine-monophosphate kinase
MSLGEFELIERYFHRPARHAALGTGDDCALLKLGPDMLLATSTDMLVEGRHFLSTIAPERLGHKALAVNLSDLAACGAKPLAFTLALALPRIDEAFLEGFARGLFALADVHDCELVGGDTTAGPLTICITVYGEVPPGQALLRNGARPEDDIYVSGTLGEARLALEVFRGTVALDARDFETVRRRMEQPSPLVALGLALRGVASSAIDISDGLHGDLSHILRCSSMGATIDIDALPCGEVLAAQPLERRREYLLAGGDDYELAFTAAPERHDAVLAAARRAGVPVTRIGRVDAMPGLRVVDAKGLEVAQRFASFDHFKP